MNSSLGPFIRLEGISVNQLPRDGKGAMSSSGTSVLVKPKDEFIASTTSDLSTFIKSVIAEAVPFIDAVAPKSGSPPTWKAKGSPKLYLSSDAPVKLFEFKVLGKELDKIQGMSQLSADRKDETWFCRRSCHRNAAEKGTASWDEFTHSFKEHHYQSESAFTPTVIGAREAIVWDTSNIEIEVSGGRWVNIGLSVLEMKHKIDPKPLKNRTFPVVQLTAALAGVQEFIVVSIPLTDFDSSPHAEYARDKSLVVAAYASIERVRILPSSGEIEWIMATASDAGGILPQWLQHLAVPGQIAHDVDLFLRWIPGQRKVEEEGREEQELKPTKMALTLDKNLPAAPAQEDTASLATVPPPPISKIEERPRVAARKNSADKSLPPAPEH
jgi:Protein of unknown function (DUF3074)